MRVGPRSALPAVKICTALLLAVVPIAMVYPGSDVILGQTSTGTAAHAAPFTAIDLTPAGFGDSHASGISGDEQVGDGNGHALLWHGSADSVVDLNPAGITESEAFSVCGGQQVGDIWVPYYQSGTVHAALWRGSAASMVDLHPSGFEQSRAFSISGEQQVGYISAPSHAVLWRGSTASMVDLHPRGFVSSEALDASGDQQVGWGVLRSYVWHALLWRGSAASVVDLHPRGFTRSEAAGTSGEEQVGSGVPQGAPSIGPDGSPTQSLLWAGSIAWTEGAWHALLWRGSTDSVVDLHPRGFISSGAYRTNGKEQVGSGVPQGASLAPPLPTTRQRFPVTHALLWRGSADSVVDLHAFLPPGFVTSYAWDIDESGDIVGSAMGSKPNNYNHAFLWRRNGPKHAASQVQNNMRC